MKYLFKITIFLNISLLLHFVDNNLLKLAKYN